MSNGPGEGPDDAVLRRLDDAFLEARQGDYFRSRVHGWLAQRADVDVELPREIAERLSSRFEFDSKDESFDSSTLDAFIIAYHAAESLVRHFLATLDGASPHHAALLALTQLRTGPGFDARLRALASMPQVGLTRLVEFAFLPDGLQATWTNDDGPSLDETREYLVAWMRHLSAYVLEWRNTYNAAKHGLAVRSRSSQWTFYSSGAEDRGQAITFIDGPVLHTLEYERVLDDEGRGSRLPDGSPALRWFWVDRSLDPNELIATAIVIADLFDWMGGVSRVRLTGEGQRIHVRAQPKPADLRRATSFGRSIKIGIGVAPLASPQANEILVELEGGSDNALAQ